MLRFKPSTLIFFSGLLWIGVGFSLLVRGLDFLMQSTIDTRVLLGGDMPFQAPLFLHKIAPMAGGVEEAAVIAIALALFLGYLKGNYVLARSIARLVTRLSTFQGKVPLYQVYPPKYYILLGSMILMGISMRWLGLPQDLRGLVCTAIGSALLNGSLIQFRYCLAIRKVQKDEAKSQEIS